VIRKSKIVLDRTTIWFYIADMPSLSPSRSVAVESDDRAEREFLESLGARVRAAREQAKLTRKRLAAIADVSERYLGQLEAGEGNISVVLLRRVAGALGATITELLSSDQEAIAERLVRRFLAQVPPNRIEEMLIRLAREVGPESAARRDRIALIGLRGAGKSTLGELYARELNVPFIELDREVEREAGLPLNEIFSIYGQAGFRQLERRCLERILAGTPRAVIAVGGGIVGEADTFEKLLGKCFTVWLKASPEEHMDRVIAQGDLRPMAHSSEAMQELKRLLKTREAAYQKADVSVDTAGVTVETALARLRAATHRS
jgi:XRE family transcriptional regulator, aerobic/anaerobic benzoate catabolism transcriptional regulator